MSQTHDNIDALGLNTERFRPESKTIQLTIVELCARLGTKYNAKNHYEINEDILWASGAWGSDDMGEISKPILSINDKIELDECEKCKHPKEEHLVQKLDTVKSMKLKNKLVWEKEYKLGFCSHSLGKKDEPLNLCGCEPFKPRLATVKGIRLVERCECGHDEDSHRWHCANPCLCKQYKPVQTVEITYEEAR